MTAVLNLATGTYQHYTDLDPVSSVIAAYRQSLKDWNTWMYDPATTHAIIGPSGRTVSCGDFAAMLSTSQMRQD